MILFPPVLCSVNGKDIWGFDPKAIPETFIAVPVKGCSGTVVAVTPSDAADAADVLIGLVAVAVYVY